MKILFVIRTHCIVYDHEVKFNVIRSQGPGGQHVNKSATAVQLNFSVINSTFPEKYKLLILKYHDHRLSKNGQITINAQRFRNQQQNKQDAINRLREFLNKASYKSKYRVATKPRKTSVKKRLKDKKNQSKLKQLRKKPRVDE